ncbi:histidine phosphatase family protein [Actinomycetospora endophytica]|uniref:Histidine phosphatase family protein n=1 Tax=Actinomycetospora endophytica TaxID=2291215 RepID=A0ABS8PIE1_9PSEU|nr:histidine phosphatase family protein [Actinomycetospora endophytica]MCD2196749.1 histidine phosphatase family protein [Actinomycetospora endophytica]
MLILVRHGLTSANQQGLLLGRADPPLCDDGREQAEALARTLPAPTRLISSPLGRARETAETIAAVSGVGVEIDDRWIELDYGDLDGCPASALDPEGWRTWRDDPTFVPAGGESIAAVGARVRAACRDLTGAAAAGDVIVVSHVSPIKAATAWALGAGDEVTWRMWVSDAAVCRIDTSGSAPRLLAFNDVTAHAAAPVP